MLKAGVAIDEWKLPTFKKHLDNLWICGARSASANSQLLTGVTNYGVLMVKNYTLDEFLKKLATADGGEALELISDFQSGAVSVENKYAEEYED